MLGLRAAIFRRLIYSIKSLFFSYGITGKMQRIQTQVNPTPTAIEDSHKFLFIEILLSLKISYLEAIAAQVKFTRI